jgi:hypothetical protein
MAQRVQVTLVCDLHDDEDTPANENVTFALDGSSYEIDLCDDHAAELRDAFAPYVGVARRLTGRTGSRTTGTARRTGRGRRGASTGGADPADVRAWARSNGVAVSERGRIPASVLEQYAASAR